jgi:hypothetical protein
VNCRAGRRCQHLNDDVVRTRNEGAALPGSGVVRPADLYLSTFKIDG